VLHTFTGCSELDAFRCLPMSKGSRGSSVPMLTKNSKSSTSYVKDGAAVLDEEPLWTQEELDSNNGQWCSRCWKQCPTEQLHLCLPCNPLLRPCRAAVSKNKNRFEKEGFSLDLVYLHDRVIILGFPAAGVEHIFRNPRLEVKRFLDSKHKGRFKLFNFCVEPGRYYDPEIFENRVCRFPYRDHNVPHLQVLDRFLKTAKSWLDEDAENVVALHCKAGKGRAGMMSCALLLHMGYCVDAKNAIAHYDKLRVWKEKALTVPSQIRYVSYAEKISNNIRVDKNFSYKDTAGVIRKILFRNNRNCKLGVVLEVQKNCIGNKEQVWESPTCSQEFELSCKVCGNVRLAIMTESGKLVGSLWFNVSFFDAEKIVFRKKEFDKLYKRDRHHKLFPEDFFVEVYADVSGVMMANPLRKKKLDSHVVEEIVV
jgi:hypothetical protein